jgi:hypothetical protein
VVDRRGGHGHRDLVHPRLQRRLGASQVRHERREAELIAPLKLVEDLDGTCHGRDGPLGDEADGLDPTASGAGELVDELGAPRRCERLLGLEAVSGPDLPDDDGRR